MTRVVSSSGTAFNNAPAHPINAALPPVNFHKISMDLRCSNDAHPPRKKISNGDFATARFEVERGLKRVSKWSANRPSRVTHFQVLVHALRRNAVTPW